MEGLRLVMEPIQWMVSRALCEPVIWTHQEGSKVKHALPDVLVRLLEH